MIKKDYKTNVKTDNRGHKKSRFFRGKQNKRNSNPSRCRRLSCGRFRFRPADLVRLAAGAVSVWGCVVLAVRPA